MGSPSTLKPSPALNILFLSQYFHPEQFLNNHVAKELAAKGHQVDVVCCVPNYPTGSFFDGYSNKVKREERWEGVSVHRVFTVPRGKSAVQLLANFLIYPIAASFRLARLRNSRADVSFVSMPSPLFQALAGMFAKRMWGIPTVYWVQDIWPDSAIITLGIKNRFVIMALNAICGALYRAADLVMVQSDGFHAKIMEFGVPAEKIVTLPNCAPAAFVPLERERVPNRIRSLIPDGRRTLMFAGNIGESQDFDTIIEAASLLPAQAEIQIVIVGSGRDEARVRHEVTRRGLEGRFIFLGRHPESDMPAFFACADMMLVSLRDEPIFALTVPSKVQAYMACGKPILASLRGEGAAIVQKLGIGIAVPPSDAEALRDAILRVQCLPDHELSEMGSTAKHAYDRSFSLEAITASLVRGLRSVVKRAHQTQSGEQI